MEELSRTEMLIGKEAVDRLKSKRVIVFGIGGVGGYVCEALARTGVGQIDIVDNDAVSLSNINRQIIALHSTVGKPKVLAMKERIFDINPQIKVQEFNTFFEPENSNKFDFLLLDDKIKEIADNVYYENKLKFKEFSAYKRKHGIFFSNIMLWMQ